VESLRTVERGRKPSRGQTDSTMFTGLISSLNVVKKRTAPVRASSTSPALQGTFTSAMATVTGARSADSK
jgi:hypothetical protein